MKQSKLNKLRELARIAARSQWAFNSGDKVRARKLTKDLNRFVEANVGFEGAPLSYTDLGDFDCESVERDGSSYSNFLLEINGEKYFLEVSWRQDDQWVLWDSFYLQTEENEEVTDELLLNFVEVNIVEKLPETYGNEIWQDLEGSRADAIYESLRDREEEV